MIRQECLYYANVLRKQKANRAFVPGKISKKTDQAPCDCNIAILQVFQENSELQVNFSVLAA